MNSHRCARRGSLALLALAATAAGAQTRMLRSPTVSATQVAFAYANNIWAVDRTGGAAHRLTSFAGATENPQFSPDGRMIAFTGDYAGNADVYVIPAEGGEPKRLTWHPGGDAVQGWTPDGKSVVFASSRATEAPSAAPRFWTVPVTGGPESPMVMNRAYQGKIAPDGKHIAYRMNNSWDDERRNYRGGQNRPIWIMDTKTLEVESPPRATVDWVVAQATAARGGASSVSGYPNADSKDIDPVWITSDQIAFISDRDGVANVWTYDAKSKKIEQVTRFTDYDVKTIDAAANGSVLVFEQAGFIHELDPKTGKEHKLNITAAGDFAWMMPEWKDVSRSISGMALSPTGKRALIEARGEIFTVPADKGDVRNLTNSSGSAEHEPTWSPDGKSIAYFSDRTGEYHLYIAPQDGLTPPREIKLQKPTHPYTAQWSPDGKRILYHDTNLHLWVLDVATGAQKIVGEDPWMVPTRTMTPSWSPDAKWIAYSKHLNSLYHVIQVVNVETGESKQVTDGLSDALWPAWDASGKYLWFLASTDLGLRSQWLDMTSYDHTESFGVYLAVLRKADPSPLLPESDEDLGIGAAPAAPAGGGGRGGRGGGGAATDSAAADATPRARGAVATVAVTIDFDGLGKRILAIPGITPGAYSRLKAGTAGNVYFTGDAAGGGGRGGGGGATLFRYQISTRRDTPFITGVTDYELSMDGHKLLYRGAAAGGGGGRGAAGGGAAPAPALFIVDADRQPPTVGAGRLTFELRAYIDPRQEFAQIFNEGWRNQRDYLYVTNQHGSDWPKVKQMYSALLPSVNHRADLNYLIDMMGSEISIGHSYVRGGEMPSTGVTPANGGLLGADFVIDTSSRYRITKIYDTENWNPDLRAPLAGPGIDVRVGDYIMAINGTDLRAPDNIYRLLDGTANKQVVLTVNDRPTMTGARTVTVVPVNNEQNLRTRAWVEQSRRLVDSLSDHQLAYVYLPNTGQPGYTSFNRYYFAQQDKKGAIVDERYNGGGQAADYIIDVLQREFDGYFNNVAGDRTPFTSPAAGIWGPKVMIINEMAGSGGDLMPYMFRSRKLGTLVGKRTWGGLVHTADTPGFVDGGSMIAPRGGFFGRDNKWRVENEGVAPDIDVENWPKDMAAGHDMQLEAAIKEGMAQLKAHPVDRLMKEPAAPEWGKRKPPQ